MLATSGGYRGAKWHNGEGEGCNWVQDGAVVCDNGWLLQSGGAHGDSGGGQLVGLVMADWTGALW